MADSADSLLRELVDVLGERPYQARDLRGPFDCVFCGGTTADVARPAHEPQCPWPRVLALVRGAW